MISFSIKKEIRIRGGGENKNPYTILWHGVNDPFARCLHPVREKLENFSSAASCQVQYIKKYFENWKAAPLILPNRVGSPKFGLWFGPWYSFLLYIFLAPVLTDGDIILFNLLGHFFFMEQNYWFFNVCTCITVQACAIDIILPRGFHTSSQSQHSKMVEHILMAPSLVTYFAPPLFFFDTYFIFY